MADSLNPTRRQNGNALAGDGSLRCHGTGQVRLGSQGAYSIPGEAYAPCLGCSDCICAYCDGLATHRVRWTVYGGGLVSKKVCEKHAARVRGQRGVEVVDV